MNAVLEANEPGARYLAAVQPPLVRQFELLATAPGGVGRLRGLILTLAVQGKLVQQDTTDESASALVQRIRSYRDQQVKAGLAKRERPLSPITEAALTFQLRAGWEWIRFEELIEPAKPISYGVLVPGPEVSGGVPFVRIADLSLTDPPAKPEKSISEEIDAQYQRTRLAGGEILMGVVGSIGKLGVAPPTWAGANIARAICRIVPVRLVDHGFVLLLLQSEFMRASFAGDTRTLAQPTLNVGLIRSSATPLPPVAEQARIVARVDELMRLCDALEAQGRLDAEQHARLLDALLGTLTDSSTPEELAANWQRVADHFDLLLDRPEAVDALEQTILQLAVRGLLVRQDPSHEPADLWVRRINSNRAHRRTAAAMPTLADTHRPDLPAGWCVTNVGSVAECLDYIRRPIKKADREANGGSVPYYGANGQTGWINEHLFDEDLVLVVEDETFIGRTKPFSYVVRGKSWVNNHAHVLRPLGGLSSDFLNLCLERYDFIPLTSGTTNRRKLTQPGLLNAEFMIGPLEEQVRILDRVTELRRLCADLRQRLTSNQTTQSQLAVALVESAAA